MAQRRSCVRLRPERPNHVWSYDFVQDRTEDGRAFRMLCVIDEVDAALPGHRGGKTVAVGRCPAVPDRAVRCARAAAAHPVGQRARVGRQGGQALARQSWREDAVHRTGQSLGEWLLQELQLQVEGRAPQQRDLHDALRSRGADRELAPPLQRRQAPLVARIPTARTGSCSGRHPAGCPTLRFGQPTG